MKKRAIAALAALAIWTVVVWFTAWDRSPATWTPDIRFFVALVGLALAALAATFPFEEFEP